MCYLRGCVHPNDLPSHWNEPISNELIERRLEQWNSAFFSIISCSLSKMQVNYEMSEMFFLSLSHLSFGIKNQNVNKQKIHRWKINGTTITTIQQQKKVKQTTKKHTHLINLQMSLVYKSNCTQFPIHLKINWSFKPIYCELCLCMFLFLVYRTEIDFLINKKNYICGFILWFVAILSAPNHHLAFNVVTQIIGTTTTSIYFSCRNDDAVI